MMSNKHIFGVSESKKIRAHELYLKNDRNAKYILKNIHFKLLSTCFITENDGRKNV